MDDPRSSIGAAFDPDEALAIVGGDKDLFLELLQTFRQNYAGELSSIRYAIGHRDPDALRHASHHFKGTLSALAAGPARHTVALLEEAGSRAAGQSSYCDSRYGDQVHKRIPRQETIGLASPPLREGSLALRTLSGDLPQAHLDELSRLETGSCAWQTARYRARG